MRGVWRGGAPGWWKGLESSVQGYDERLKVIYFKQWRFNPTENPNIRRYVGTADVDCVSRRGTLGFAGEACRHPWGQDA
jgi:hypothetical protein